MDLSRAIGRFSNTPILGWDSDIAEWADTGICGSLSAFDRFITQRTFGQKKRILLTNQAEVIPTQFEVVKLDGSDHPFILEGYNEDVANAEVYNLTYLIHQAYVSVQIMENVKTQRASGAYKVTGETVVETTWGDVERYTSDSSDNFEEVNTTVNFITLPKSALVTTDRFLKISGVNYSIDEVFKQLDVTIVKSRSLGFN